MSSSESNMNANLELEFLQHIELYRLTVPEAVAKVFGISLAQAIEALEQLRTQRYINSVELMPGTEYFYLQPRAAEVLRVASVQGGPICGNAKVEAFATLYYCCLEGIYRPKISTDVFRTRFAELFRPGPKTLYCTEGSTLRLLRVETRDNTSGDVHRLLERASRDIQKRLRPKNQPQNQAFKELLDSNRFCVTVLTPFAAKAKLVQERVERVAERHYNYHKHVELIERGETRTPQAFFREYNSWHKKDDSRPPPPAAPPMEISVVPDLFDLMYPKSIST